MSNTVIIALISSGAAVLSAVMTGLITGSKTIYRIDQLEKKVDMHNGLVERMVVVEQKVSFLKQEVEQVE
ncbi:MAG: hypothetical protein WC365_09595 [Candidatus Babeliales bacterium]|jgi:hypothetical protein